METVLLPLQLSPSLFFFFKSKQFSTPSFFAQYDRPPLLFSSPFWTRERFTTDEITPLESSVKENDDSMSFSQTPKLHTSSSVLSRIVIHSICTIESSATYLDAALVLRAQTHWTRDMRRLSVTNVGDDRCDRFDESRYERLIRRSCGTFSSGKRREGWRDRQHFGYLTRLLYYLWGRKFERWAQLPWAEQSGLSSLPGQFRPVSRSPPPDPCRSSIVKLTVSLRNRSSERFSSNYRNACARTIPSLFHDQEEDRLRDRLNS